MEDLPFFLERQNNNRQLPRYPRNRQTCQQTKVRTAKSYLNSKKMPAVNFVGNN